MYTLKYENGVLQPQTCLMKNLDLFCLENDHWIVSTVKTLKGKIYQIYPEIYKKGSECGTRLTSCMTCPPFPSTDYVILVDNFGFRKHTQLPKDRTNLANLIFVYEYKETIIGVTKDEIVFYKKWKQTKEYKCNADNALITKVMNFFVVITMLPGKVTLHVFDVHGNFLFDQTIKHNVQLYSLTLDHNGILILNEQKFTTLITLYKHMYHGFFPGMRNLMHKTSSSKS